MLKNENQRLQSGVNKLGNELAQLESSVDQLHQKDSDFYRSILDMDEISNGVWNGGTGGAADIHSASQPEILREAEKRLARLSQKVQIQFNQYDVLYSELSSNEKRLQHTPAIKPVKGRLISGYGNRMHPILLKRRKHWGVDLQASTGTPVYATGDATVKFAGRRGNGYGIYIDLDHGYGYESKYAHLSKLNVKRGQHVKRGDVIGYSGNTGLSKGPHLHYEIIKDGKKIDPIDYFYADLTPEEFVKLRQAAAADNESMD